MSAAERASKGGQAAERADLLEAGERAREQVWQRKKVPVSLTCLFEFVFFF